MIEIKVKTGSASTDTGRISIGGLTGKKVLQKLIAAAKELADGGTAELVFVAEHGIAIVTETSDAPDLKPGTGRE